MVTVRQATARDRRAIVDVLATAFADDPVTRWLCRSSRQDRRMLLLHLRLDSSYADVAEADGRVTGASLWAAPDRKSSAIAELAALPLWLWALGRDLDRGSQLVQTFARVQPAKPFLYLATLGAAVRGQGAGTAMLSARLDGYDGRVYLESSKEANIPLYERFGFRVLDEVRLPNGGPPFWPMLRE